MDPLVESPPSTPTRPASESDWGQFVDAYGRAILDWLRQTGLATAEADVLTRHLLQFMAREFGQIARERDVRFRAWLNYAAHAAWCGLMETRVDDLGGEQSPALALLLSVEAHDTFVAMLDAECSHQRRREVLPRVQPQAEPADWEAFYLVVLEGVPVPEVATRLNCTELAAHAALYRVGKLLRQEMQTLEEKC